MSTDDTVVINSGIGDWSLTRKEKLYVPTFMGELLEVENLISRGKWQANWCVPKRERERDFISYDTRHNI